MIFVFWICLAIVCAYLLTAIWQLSVLYRYTDKTEEIPNEWPEITIMVAARNEEKHIGNSLQALCTMDYPKEKLHVIVGNDQSTDRTEAIALDFVSRFPFVELINIVDDDSGLKAKARVMAQLDRHARGDFYLVTDADVAVKPTWAKWMVRHMRPEIGVASGTTMVIGNDLWSTLQEIDWAYFMGLLNIISYSGVPATAVGNNMIIRRQAYWDTGGYAAIRFSITEDYKLYSEVCKKGWKWNNIMIPEVLAYSGATPGYLPLLHQRKRWLSGGTELPFYWWILFGIFGLYYFCIPFILVLQPILGLVIALVKWTIQTVQINRIHRLLGEKPPSLLQHLTYEFYLFLVTISTAIFFILPIKTVWKNRSY